MGIDNLILSPVVLQEVYKHHLIGDVSPQKSKLTSSIGNLKYLGGYEKNIAVLVHCEKAAYLPDAHLSFLVKILEACKIHISDVAILNTCDADKSFYEKALLSKPAIILLFDVDMAALGFPLAIPHYQIQAYNDMKIVSFPNLADIQTDVAQKNKVWSALKKIFAI